MKLPNIKMIVSGSSFRRSPFHLFCVRNIHFTDFKGEVEGAVVPIRFIVVESSSSVQAREKVRSILSRVTYKWLYLFTRNSTSNSGLKKTNLPVMWHIVAMTTSVMNQWKNMEFALVDMEYISSFCIYFCKICRIKVLF